MSQGNTAIRTMAQRQADTRLAWQIVIGCAVLTVTLLVVAVTTLVGPAGHWIEGSLEHQRAEAERRRAASSPGWPDDEPEEPRTTPFDQVSPPPVVTGPLSTTPGSARPIGDVEQWVTSADYPPAALRAGIEGRTRVTLTVGSDGQPTGCAVIASSGHQALDRATCAAMLTRGRFNPPGGTRRWTSPFIRWQLPR